LPFRQFQFIAVSAIADDGEADEPESPMSHQDTHHPVLTAVEAREGVTGHNVRYVLVVGIAGVVIAFGALWFYFFG
jgi:hypothetical protein